MKLIKVDENYKPPHSKHFSSYPSIKIGRFAVSKAHQGKGIGRKVMFYMKLALLDEEAYSAFRFLTVDAYLPAIPFYKENDFEPLLSHDKDKHTRLMFFDMMKLTSIKEGYSLTPL